MKDHYALRFVLIVIAVLTASQLYAQAAQARENRPPGLPNYTHPKDPQERAEARSRAWRVYRSIEAATDDPELREELWRICRRESMCNWMRPVGLHRGETAALGRLRWSRAVKRGYLSPEVCEAHSLGDARRCSALDGEWCVRNRRGLRGAPPWGMRAPRVHVGTGASSAGGGRPHAITVQAAQGLRLRIPSAMVGRTRAVGRKDRGAQAEGHGKAVWRGLLVEMGGSVGGGHLADAVGVRRVGGATLVYGCTRMVARVTANDVACPM